jgi:predicted acylesterase/phospholipase RssA
MAMASTWFPWLRVLMEQRFGLLFLGLLTCWVPIVRVFPARALLDNALLLESYPQLMLVSFLNAVAIVCSVAILRLLQDRRPSEVRLPCIDYWIGSGKSPWTDRQWLLVGSSALVTPLCLVTWFGSEFSELQTDLEREVDWMSHGLRSLVAVLSGWFAAIALLMLLGWIRTFFFGSRRSEGNYFPFESRAHRAWLRQGKAFAIHLMRRTFLRGADIQMGFYATLLMLFHLLLTRAFDRYQLGWVTVPSVVVVALWVLGMLLTGAAYWLDRVRIPVVLAIVAALAILQSIPGLRRHATLASVPHQAQNNFQQQVAGVREADYQALREDLERVEQVQLAAQGLQDIAWEAVVRRMERVPKHPKHGKTLVVVTCPGGGIHAAAWASMVLQSLSNRYDSFGDSVAVISSVSGGGVASLYFTAALQELQAAKASGHPRRMEIFEPATRSSLESIAMGMMTDELYGLLFPMMRWSDRGERLEQSWVRRLPLPWGNATLDHWGDLAHAGSAPIVVFNATDAVTGRRVLFDSIPTPFRWSNIGLTSRPLNYRELIDEQSVPKTDIKLVSAARASASFPFISPFVRLESTNQQGRGLAIGDGAYVDNEGIVSAIDWIEFLFRRWHDLPKGSRPFDRMMLLHLNPSRSGDALDPPQASPIFDSLRWLTGPMEAMLRVRSTSQLERGHLEKDLTDLWGESFLGRSLKESPQWMQMPSMEAVTTRRIAPPAERLPATNPLRDKATRDRFRQTHPEATMPRNRRVPMPPQQKAAALQNAVPSVQERIERDPILVLEIPFELSDPSAIIPLNWKLSRSQKRWYGKVWEETRHTNQELTELLDQLFGP